MSIQILKRKKICVIKFQTIDVVNADYIFLIEMSILCRGFDLRTLVD